MAQYSVVSAKIDVILAEKPLKIAHFQAVFGEISLLLDQKIGHKLLTFTVIHPNGEYVIRLFSNLVGDYALEDTKPMVKDEWSAKVIGRGECFYVSTEEEMKPIFPDYQKIFDMGLGSAMNIPVQSGGKTIGTANLLDADGAYRDVDFAPLIKICQLVAPIFVAYREYNCKD